MLNKLIEKMPDESDERLVFSHYCVLALPAVRLVNAGSTWQEQENYLIDAFRNG